MVDDLCLVNIACLLEGNPLEDLVSKLKVAPKHKAYPWGGGTAPQWFVNRTADRISSGQTRLALICGGDAFRSMKLMVQAQGGASLDGPAPIPGAKNRPFGTPPPKEPWMVGEMRDPLTALEIKYGLLTPVHVYALYEHGLRHRHGMSLDDQRRELGGFCARMSAVAAKNPYAWFTQARTSEEIVEVTDANRIVSFPYTVNMCAIITVDQAAALFMTDAQTASELGVPEDTWVYPLGGADASDLWNVSRRLNYYATPSGKEAADQALKQAGLSLEQVDYMELYSCFPSPPRVMRDMLGIRPDDPRPLTVTGGLAYFGGPGNNYSLHAICRIVELVRKRPERHGLVQALSFYLNKHSIGVYGGQPGSQPWEPAPVDKYQKKLDRIEGPAFVDEATGLAEVETYALFHDRQGLPTKAVVIGRLEDGARFLSHAEPDEGILTAMTQEEFIGRRGRVRAKDGFNVFYFH
jgi:acetyl-CoA C-acetyltransferase